MKHLLLSLFIFSSIALFSQAPENDNCVDATVVSEGSGIAFSTIEATTDGPEHANASCFAFGGDGVYNDVWYSFIATANTYMEWSTCDNANFDTRLAVYNAGATCPIEDEDLMACSDDGADCLNFTSYLFFEVEMGQTYILRIGGYQEGEIGEGTFDLNAIADPEFSSHSTCSDADARAVISTEDADNNMGWTFGDNLLAPAEEGTDVPFCSGPGEYYDVWYSFNNGANDSIEIRFETITEDALYTIEIYDDCDTIAPTAGDGGELIINCFPTASVASGSMWLFAFEGPGDHLIRISTQITNDIPGEFKFQLVGTDEAVSIEELEGTQVTVFPNPVRDVLNVQTPFANSFGFVYDLDGRLIHRSNFNSSNGYIDVSRLSPGSYVLEIRAEGQIARKKFLIH